MVYIPIYGEIRSDPIMKLEGILPFTRSILIPVIATGDTVVDATMGNGLDTLFLATQVGATGKVLAYDIQEEALRKTRQRLEEAGQARQVQLYLKGHQTVEEELSELQPPQISAAMFNLGYLPGGDKQVVTSYDSTIQALLALRKYLKKNGIISVVIYSGHEEGKQERDRLVKELCGWDQREYAILHYQFVNQRNDPPFLMAIQKK